MMLTVSDVDTPWAVHCEDCSEREDGLVFMTEAFYLDQLLMPDNRWVCPACFKEREWSDDNHEEFISLAEEEA